MKVLLTLDYEMFNGVNGGSVENCIIKPMYELQKVLSSYNFKITLFVDVCFLLRLRELSGSSEVIKADYTSICNQLKELSSFGHDIQLHIHPNWVRGTYENGQYKSFPRDFKLSDIPATDVQRLISEGKLLLEEITGKPVVAFRAGAYCIQTMKGITDIFKKNNIIIDSSVLRNKKSITEKWEWYDYTNIPLKYVYQFNCDVTKESTDGRFTEISIPSYKINPLSIIYNKIKYRLCHKEDKKWGDGKGSIGTMDGRLKKIQNKILRLLNPFIAANIDDTTSAFIKTIYQKEIVNKSPYMMIMGHPKNFSPYTIRQFELFLMNNINSIECARISDYV